MSISKRTKRYKYDLYISYHRAQRDLVESFCDQVKNDNLKIWYDESNNSSTFNVRALESSAMFVCFPSKEYKKSMKNRIEYSIALEQEMKIITMDEFLIESTIQSSSSSSSSSNNTEINDQENQNIKHEENIQLQNNKTNENFINSFFKLIKNQTEIFSQKLYKFIR